jgi:hypothetical protein
MTTNRTHTRNVLAFLSFVLSITTLLAQKPKAVNDNVTTVRNIAVTFKPTQNDTLNGRLTTLGIVTAPKKGSIGFLTLDSLLYAPQLNQCDYKDTMVYFICNDKNLCDTGRVFFNVTCSSVVLKRPKAVNDTFVTQRNVSISFKPMRNDSLNGNALSALGIAVAPRHGSIGYITTDSLIYVPKRDTCSYRDSITYFICNENTLCDTAKIYITVDCPINPLKPKATNDSYTTRKNTPLFFNPLTNDNINGDKLIALGLVREPRRGSIGFPKMDSMVYIPNYNQCNYKDTITYKICNGSFLCDTANIVISVTCEETFALKPYLSNDFINTTKNKAIVFNPLANDLANGRIVSLGLASDPKNGSLTFLAIDTIRYTPKQDFCGQDTFKYHICNERFQCDTGFVFINVSCDSILAPTNVPVIVTFRVKLDAAQSAPVHIVGDFQKDAGFPANWDASSMKMEGPINGYYQFTDTLFNRVYQYKFLKNNTWQDLVTSSYAEQARFDLLGCGVLNGSGIANRLLNLSAIRSPLTRILVTQDWNTCSKGFLESYTVSVTANPSIGGTATGSGAFFPGDSVTVRATVKAGYKFVNWTESTLSVSRDSVYKFALPTGSRSLVANFERSTSVQDLPDNSIAIYPNPTAGRFSIQIDNDLIIKELVISDVLGRQILRGYVAPNQTQYDVDLSSQAKGLYFIHIKTEGGQLTKKVLVK